MWSLPQKNIGQLEQKIEQLQAEIRDRDADIAQLKDDLKNGKPVDMSPKDENLVSNVIADTLSDLGLGAAESDAPKKSATNSLRRMMSATRAFKLSVAKDKPDEEKTEEELEAENEASMPNWTTSSPATARYGATGSMKVTLKPTSKPSRDALMTHSTSWTLRV